MEIIKMIDNNTKIALHIRTDVLTGLICIHDLEITPSDMEVGELTEMWLNLESTEVLGREIAEELGIPVEEVARLSYEGDVYVHFLIALNYCIEIHPALAAKFFNTFSNCELPTGKDIHIETLEFDRDLLLELEGEVLKPEEQRAVVVSPGNFKHNSLIVVHH